MDDLRELIYSINFDTDTKGLKNAISAEKDIDRGLKDAAKSANKMGRAFETITDSVNETAYAIGDIEDKANRSEISIKSLGKAIAGTFVVKKIIDFGKKSVSIFSDFEQSMANVRATMGDISDGDFNSLWMAAKEAGATTIFSATEAGNALYFLASAGFETKKAIETLNPLLDLAAAGGLNLDRASELVTGTMSVLGLEAKDLNKFMDQMAVTSQKTNTNIDQLGEAILNSGGVAKSAGLDTASLSAELGILASAGKRGAEGGTALRNIILNLTAPTDQVAQLMKELGVNITDNKGKIRPLNNILMELRDKMGGFTEGQQQAIKAMIGGKENVQSLNILLDGAGDTYEKLKKQIIDSNGAAKKMAETQQKTVKGAFKELLSAIEDVQISLFETEGTSEGLQGTLRGIAGFMPKVSNELQYASAQARKFFGFIMDNKDTIIPAVTGIAGAFLAFKSIAMAQGILDKFKKSSFFKIFGEKGLSAALSANPIFLIAAGIGLLAGVLVYAYRNSEDFRNAVGGLLSDLGDLVSFVMECIVPIFTGAFQSLWDTIKAIAINIGQVIEGIMEILSGVIDFIFGIFTGDLDRAGEGIKQIFTGIFDVLKGAFKGFINFLTSGINLLIGGLNKIHFKVPDWMPKALGGGTEFGINIPEIPRLAKGGTVRGDTMAITDEEGGELKILKDGTTVVPHDLSKSYLNRSGMGSNATINAPITIKINDSNTPRETAMEVENVVRKALNDAFGQLNIQLGYVNVEPSF